MRKLIYGLSALAAVAAIAIAVLAYRIIDQGMGSTATIVGEASIGGPFTLIDGAGETVTAADFAGKPMLVYFGFTFCPEICPTELLNIADAIDLLPADVAQRIQPIFITVDPERDTPEVVGEYAGNFHPRMVGLTGTPEQVRTAAQAYRVYYAKEEPAGGGLYMMAHSSYIYLMDGEGRYVRHFRMGTTPEEIAAAVMAHAETK